MTVLHYTEEIGFHDVRRTVCGKLLSRNQVTTTLERVTCVSCKRTRMWRENL